MELLYILEKIRIPVLNELMLAITTLGEETAFLIVGLIVFWCVDKRKGYYIMFVGFMGTMINQILKLAFRIPRPWVIDPAFPILEQARAAAGGYSFPSGHTQSAVGTFGSIAAFTQKKWIRIACVSLAVLVGFSRMYVGVHTPADVLAAAMCAVILIFALKKPMLSGGDKGMKATLIATIGLSILFLCYVDFWKFPADMDVDNMTSGFRNAYTMLGCGVGMAIVYVTDRKWLNFQVEAPWWVQILKCAGGLLLVLLVRKFLRAPLELLMPVYPARAARYFLIVLTAGIFWPMSFRFFQNWGLRNELRNDKKL